MDATRPVHLQGMGILGSLLAWHLARAGVPFTWEDNESAINAWSVSTGAIYPSGEALDMENYAIWKRWSEHEPPWPREWDMLEPGAYWFASKHPPHGGKYNIQADLGALRLAGLPSYHLNAQTLVERTRQTFAQMRQPMERGQRRVIAHGFNQYRLDHYVWGWMVPVVLSCAPALLEHSGNRRPALYLREGRFIMAYAYLTPGTDRYYAGSSLIVQRQAKPLEIASKFERWQETVARLSGGLVQTRQDGPYQQGWRPAGAKDDPPLVRLFDAGLVVPSLWHSGIRWAPRVCQQTLDYLGAAV